MKCEYHDCENTAQGITTVGRYAYNVCGKCSNFINFILGLTEEDKKKIKEIREATSTQG